LLFSVSSGTSVGRLRVSSFFEPQMVRLSAAKSRGYGFVIRQLNISTDGYGLQTLRQLKAMAQDSIALPLTK